MMVKKVEEGLSSLCRDVVGFFRKSAFADRDFEVETLVCIRRPVSLIGVDGCDGATSPLLKGSHLILFFLVFELVILIERGRLSSFYYSL